MFMQLNPSGLDMRTSSMYFVFNGRCQEGLLDNMTLGPNIAKNAALRENVFMMAVCIELRIPLFLVGKPGSSKSLAKSIIQDSMHGQGSQKKLLREFKQVRWNHIHRRFKVIFHCHSSDKQKYCDLTISV